MRTFIEVIPKFWVDAKNPNRAWDEEKGPLDSHAALSASRPGLFMVMMGIAGLLPGLVIFLLQWHFAWYGAPPIMVAAIIGIPSWLMTVVVSSDVVRVSGIASEEMAALAADERWQDRPLRDRAFAARWELRTVPEARQEQAFKVLSDPTVDDKAANGLLAELRRLVSDERIRDMEREDENRRSRIAEERSSARKRLDAYR